jgi:short-subunit dehydrogenase
MSRNVVIVGATSAIAQEVARHFADARDRLLVVARDAAKLQAVAKDLVARGASGVDELVCDLADLAALPGLLSKLAEAAPRLDVVLVAHGVLGDQAEAERDWAHAEMLLRVNFTSVAALLTPVANLLEKQGSGTIAIISSVAGDRGRATNYVYGAAKAATTAFASGLRNRLAKKGVHVVTINPGFVATPMTAHLKKGPLVADPRSVGQTIFRAIEAKKDVAYVPGFWRLIMFVIRHIPERIFKRLRL